MQRNSIVTLPELKPDDLILLESGQAVYFAAPGPFATMMTVHDGEGNWSIVPNSAYCGLLIAASFDADETQEMEAVR